MNSNTEFMINRMISCLTILINLSPPNFEALTALSHVISEPIIQVFVLFIFNVLVLLTNQTIYLSKSRSQDNFIPQFGHFLFNKFLLIKCHVSGIFMKINLKAFNSLHQKFDIDLIEKGQKFLVIDFSPLQAMNLCTKSLRSITLLLQQI